MKKSIFFSFSLIGQVGFAVATPAVVFTVVGKLIDQKLDTSPKFLLALLGLSMVISYFTIRKIAMEAIKKLNKMD